jgi:hypothetical protein
MSNMNCKNVEGIGHEIFKVPFQDIPGDSEDKKHNEVNDVCYT